MVDVVPAAAPQAHPFPAISEPPGFEPFRSMLDLTRVIGRVKKENPDWTPARVATAEQEYRKWLFLCSIKPKGTCLGMGPKDVDKVWHTHILFTRKYLRDCVRLCGQFVHHRPTTDAEKQKGDNSNYQHTLELYESTFHERHPQWFARGLKDGDCDCRGPTVDCCDDPNDCNWCGND
eukprot:INCI19869.1.p1 GENE.INCI19869.1~~INCI19869.1.p1  ORF type:complete len:177 (+),score=21.08 INCI19869.1:91-621(+)